MVRLKKGFCSRIEAQMWNTSVRYEWDIFSIYASFLKEKMSFVNSLPC